MKIIKNEKLIKRNSKIGQYTSLGALVVLGIGMYISFTRSELFIWAVGALLLGFTLTQIGMYFGNRWGRSPRPDEKLDSGLKGLHKDFNIYHWSTPIAHLLVGPGGIWVLIPYHQRGHVTYRKNRWRMSGGGFLQNYMRLFLAKEMEEDEIPEIQAALVFTADGAEIDVEEAPLPALPLKKLKDFMRNKAKERPISVTDLEKVKAALPE